MQVDCRKIAPEVFWRNETDRLTYVKEDDPSLGETKLFEPSHGLPGGAEGVARVPEAGEAAVVRAAHECPGVCINVVEDIPPPIPEGEAADVPAAPPTLMQRARGLAGRVLRKLGLRSPGR